MTQRIDTLIEETNSEVQKLHADISALSSPQRITQITNTLKLPLKREENMRSDPMPALEMPLENDQLTPDEEEMQNAR